VTNFFSNINDIGVSINDIFQLKFLNGGMDLSRFVINTTVGVAGIFDVASQINLPKHNEDFGQTLGFWGVPAGPYLVLPVIGPSTPRDTAGLIGDAALNPLTYVSLFGGFAGAASTAGANAVNATDHRANLIPAEKVIDEGSNGNRYDFIKSTYLQHREYLIHDGNLPDSSDPLDVMDSDTGSNDQVIQSEINGHNQVIKNIPFKGKRAVVEVLPIQAQ
jgi:phospholipid-binding lipoprotein MlaA